MVKKVLPLLLCLSCMAIVAQRKPKIKGNKSVIEVREDLPAFHGLELMDNLEIVLQKSTEPGYTITADDNLIGILKFEVVDSVLTISSFYTITAKKQLDIVVRYNELRSIEAEDGKIISEGIISTDELSVHTLGFSRLDIQWSAAVSKLHMDDNSKAQINVDSDSLTVNLGDKINANIYAVSRTHSLTMDSDALANLEGNSENLTINMWGTTKLRAEGLEAGAVELDIAESASARIQAVEKLRLTSSDGAKVFLYGEPGIEIVQFSDTSELYKRNP